MVEDITVLRLGHRYHRDARLSTHIGLVARAFGAKELVLDVEDDHVAQSIDSVVAGWGGEFEVSCTSNAKKFIKEFEGKSIHLTMYGLPLNSTQYELKSIPTNILVIIGGQKVPADIYHLVDYNIAVGAQPHSEAAALAVLLDRIWQGDELDWEFPGGKKIIPQKAGKKVSNDNHS